MYMQVPKNVELSFIMCNTFKNFNNILFYFLSVRPSKEPGWLEGTLNGKTGLIPANYVEFLN